MKRKANICIKILFIEILAFRVPFKNIEFISDFWSITFFTFLDIILIILIDTRYLLSLLGCIVGYLFQGFRNIVHLLWNAIWYDRVRF